MTIREWWSAKGRAVEQKNARLAAVAGQQAVSAAGGLRDLSDGEFTALGEPWASLSHPDHEMEMQRRLKDSIEAPIESTTVRRHRSRAFW